MKYRLKPETLDDVVLHGMRALGAAQLPVTLTAVVQFANGYLRAGGEPCTRSEVKRVLTRLAAEQRIEEVP